MRRSAALAIALAAAGCVAPPPADEAPALADGAALAVHEWGLVSSLQGADGLPVDGLGHAEEALPAFVHAAASAPGFAVQQQLQTPVLYFHGATEGAVHVAVALDGGAFASWYPAAATASDGGRLVFDVALGPADGSLVAPSGSAVWDALRAVDAAAVDASGERERFVFYRGLARVDERVRVTHEADGRMAIANTGVEPIAAAFLVHVHAGGGAIDALGPIAGRASVFAEPTPKELDPDLFAENAAALVAPALEAAGLTKDEARAALASWSENVFRTPGLRVLYLWPRAWVDALLPLELTPTPRELARVHVGRVEVLTRWDEAELVARIREAQPTGDASVVADLGPFAEPKLRRARALIDDPTVAAFADELIALASAAAH